MDSSSKISFSKEDYQKQQSPQFKLVGNYLPEITENEFPPKPPLKLVDCDIVARHVCVSTNGSARIFVPIDLLDRLSNGERVGEYEIILAPGIQRNRTDVVFNAHTRTEMADLTKRHFEWYHKCSSDAMKPIKDLVLENGHPVVFSTSITAIFLPTWSDIYNITKLKIEADLILRMAEVAQTD